MWKLFFVVSSIILLITVAFAIWLYLHPKKIGKALTPFNIVFVGVFITVLISHIPVFYGINSTELRGVYSIVLSLHNTFQIFTINSDLRTLLDESNCPEYYSVFIAVETVVAPLLAFGFLASFLKDFSSGVRLLLNFWRKAYVFSDLNEKSLALGTSIREKTKHSVIVFAGVEFGKNSSVDSLLNKARSIRAICFSNDINSIKYGIFRNQIRFFALSDDEEKNVEDALAIIEHFQNKQGISNSQDSNTDCFYEWNEDEDDDKNPRVYVFTKEKIGEIVFEKIECSCVKVRRVNEVQSLIYRFLYDEGKILFQNAVSINNESEKQINAVILGLGHHGKEMLKALSWYGQMDGYHIVIDAFDKSENAEKQLIAEMPELLSPGFNVKKTPDDANYSIYVHSGIDVETAEFKSLFYRIHHPTFVFVSLGTDELNVRTAVNVRMLSERLKVNPSIRAIVWDSKTSEILKNALNFANQPYDIVYIGDISSSYSKEIIINSVLEQRCRNSYEDDAKEDLVLLSNSIESARNRIGTEVLQIERIKSDHDRSIEMKKAIDLMMEELLKTKLIQKKEVEPLSERIIQRTLLGKHDPSVFEIIDDSLNELNKAVTEMIKQKVQVRELRFWKYDYNYRSKIASIIHERARLECGIPGAGKKKSDLSGEEERKISSIEHRRWNAYMRAEGYIFSGSTNPGTRNDLGKMHYDLINCSLLPEDEKYKDKRTSELCGN